MPNNKKTRRELARKKAKLKRRITIAACSALLLALIAAIAIAAIISARTQTFSDGYATFEMRPTGRFSASLYHNESFKGTYTTSESGGATLVHLSHDGVTVIGMILDMGFVLPDEWLDGHGHGSVLPAS